MHAKGLLGIERVDVDRGRIGHQLHVDWSIDFQPAIDEPSKHEAFPEEVLVHQIGHQA